MAEKRESIDELDRFWYLKLHDTLPSGVLRAIGRFAFGILKEMVKLSSLGYEEFPSRCKGYILEKVMSIIRRTQLEEEILLEIMKYMDEEARLRLERKIKDLPSPLY